jgi:hypothetical protein
MSFRPEAGDLVWTDFDPTIGLSLPQAAPYPSVFSPMSARNLRR